MLMQLFKLFVTFITATDISCKTEKMYKGVRTENLHKIYNYSITLLSFS